MHSRILLLLFSRHQRWTYKISKGFRWAVLWGIVLFLSSTQGINSRNPTETLRRESLRLRSGHINFNNSPFNTNYNNRMNSNFNHPLGSGSKRTLPNENTYQRNNDLSASAQTLYDLRGFHIPLGGQEETQRFLRQHNHNQLQPDHQTTPLVFPSFFQPQQQHRHETQPQAINIFGHNQHHQQTQRFQAPEPVHEFRPSQPDLGLTTTTENIFRPVQPVTVEVQSNQNQRRPTSETPNIEEVYVYDDTDYQLELEQPVENLKQQLPKGTATSPTAGIISTAAVPEEHNDQQNQQGLFRLRELPPAPISHNTFFIQDQRNDNRFDQFDLQNENDINSLPARPNVEIVPSSERKPPEYINTLSVPNGQNLNENRIIYQNDRKGKSPLRFGRPPRPTPPDIQLQNFPVLQEEPPRNFQHQNVNNNIFQRNRHHSFDDQNPSSPLEQFPQLTQQVTSEVEDEKLFKYDPVIVQKLNPHLNQGRLRAPQRLRPVNTLIPQIYLDNPPPTEFIDEENQNIDQSIVEIPTTTFQPPTTTTTTKVPQRVEVSQIRPFSIRNRVPTRTTTSTTTTTTLIPKRRTIRPRIRLAVDLSTTTTTTTAATVQLQGNSDYESTEIETPKFVVPPQDNKPIAFSRSRGSPLIRPRTTPASSVPTVNEFSSKLNQQLALHRERQVISEVHSIPNPNDQFERNSPGIILRPESHIRFQEEFVRPYQIFNGNFQPDKPIQNDRRLQQLRYNQPRFRQPPPPVFSGKPLYITGKMLGKEGGLYAGQAIPPGHIYGSPIPLLPINNVFERIPNILDGQVPFQQRRVSPSVIRQRQNSQAISITNENNGVSPQEKTLISNAQAKEEKSLANVAQTQRARIRPPLRRKLRPNPNEHQKITISPSRQESVKPSNKEFVFQGTEAEILLSSNEVIPSSPPRLINPRRRPKRPRVLVSNLNPFVTGSDEQKISSPQSARIRPRIRPRKQRPAASLNTTQSLVSESTPLPVITQSSVQIFRKPTEAPGRFSSRYRDENILPTAAPTQPSIQILAKVKSQEGTYRRPAIKVIKAHKIVSPTTQATFVPSGKPKTKIRAKDPEVEDGLPPSIYLSPKDVLINRKPARRIPPGSYSDRIKALQARRKNNKLRTTTPIKVNPVKEVQNSSDDDDDEEYEVDSQSSNIEQVQNKREIQHRHKGSLKSLNDVKGSDSDSDASKLDLPSVENSTEANSEETLSVLGIKSLQLVSLEEAGGEPDAGEGIQRESEITVPNEKVEPVSALKGSKILIFNSDIKHSTKSLFNIFTMSTEEPSLPLEAYFPILSSPQ